jgi:dolichol-phosphate mannosyltransferase
LPDTTRVCVEVPTYNERENIGPFLDAVRSVSTPEWSVLFVDDSSPDGTGEAIRERAGRDPSVHILVRKEKMGIGSAHQDGFREALRSLSPSVIVQMDADLQHPPSAIGKLVSAIEQGADVAVASRYIPGGGSSNWSLWRRTVSHGANFYARTLLGLKVKDATSGFKAYNRAAAELLANSGLPTKGFEFQVTSLRLLQRSMKIVEVPYTFSARTAGTSKLRTSDVLRFILSVLRISLS